MGAEEGSGGPEDSDGLEGTGGLVGSVAAEEGSGGSEDSGGLAGSVAAEGSGRTNTVSHRWGLSCWKPVVVASIYWQNGRIIHR